MTLSNEHFYLPYQFVPVTGTCNGQPVSTAACADIAHGNLPEDSFAAGARHDLWLKGHRSGRILCRLTTETPTFVGGERSAIHNADVATRVSHAMMGDRPFIPGNSLRGVISSLVEGISQSTLRVLGDRRLSVRQHARDRTALSAIGLVVRDEDGQLALQPQTLPTLVSHQNNPTQFVLPRKWASVFFLRAGEDQDLRYLMSAYFDGTAPNGARPGTAARGIVDAANQSNHYGVRMNTISGQDTALLADIREVHGQLIVSLRDNQHAHIKHARNSHYLIGWKPEAAVRQVALTPWRNGMQDDHIEGRVRIISQPLGEETLPNTKRHELFVPSGGEDPPLRLPQAVIQAFSAICAERHAANPALPYVPFGTAGAAERAKDSWLREGDLVFFDVEMESNEPDAEPVVSRVAFSGIWRTAINGSVYAAVERLGRANKPLTGAREALSPAEALFGVVRELDAQEKGKKLQVDLPALRSRVTVFDALPVGDVDVQEPADITLQILSSPKPSSPSFYFSAEGDVVLRKRNLNLNTHQPRGRKVYLHHPAQQIDARMFESKYREQKLRDQKVRIKPLRPGVSFDFQVGYENLSDAELALLLTALRPSADFRHRIGMGKPLGLGTVRIDVLAVAEIDRYARYNEVEALTAPRFAHLHSAKDIDAAVLVSSVDTANKTEDFVQGQQAAWLKPSTSLVDRSTLAILRTLGEMNGRNPRHQNPDYAVAYPRTGSQLTALVQGGNVELAESELFKWNVENDNSNAPQGLANVAPGGPLVSLRAINPA